MRFCLRSSKDLVGHTVISPGWEYLGMTLNVDGTVSLRGDVFNCFHVFSNVFSLTLNKINKTS